MIIDASNTILGRLATVAAKQALYAELEPQMKDGAVLATNTSSIPLAALSEGLARPARLVGLHFFNPVAVMPLLEIVKGDKTDDVTISTAFAMGKKIKAEMDAQRERLEKLRRRALALVCLASARAFFDHEPVRK